MMTKRWQPPPMDDGTQVQVDERVVRKMLRVNPELRNGRTTIQVKAALERGEAVVNSIDEPEEAAPSADAAGELHETVGYFVRGRAASLRQGLDVIDARRRELDAEEEKLRAEMRRKMIAFVKLLDEAVVAVHGREIFSKYSTLLQQVGLTPSALLDAAGGRNA